MAMAANQAQFTIQVATIETPLKVYGFEGDEGISRNYTMAVTIVCDKADLELENWLQLPVCLILETNNPQQEANRYIHGMIYSIEQLSLDPTNPLDRHCRYKLTITPKIERLKHRRNHRIFQQKSVPEIIEQILVDAGIFSNEYQFKFSSEHKAREYCVQYGESDLAFIQRLMSEEGIHYHFQHSEHSHLMVIADGQDGFLQLPALPYAQHNGMAKERDIISQFQVKQQVSTGKVTLRDYHFKKPEFKPQGQKQTNIVTEQPLECYQFPGQFKTEAVAKRRASIGLEQHRTEHTLITGRSDAPQMTSGYYQPLIQHPNQAWNDDWLVIGVIHKGKQPQVLEEFADGAATYQAEFTCTPWDVPFRSLTQPKPLIHGEQTAFVTGPEGEEIYCDEFGRVKVQFHWDREGQADEKTSCWLRTSQGWAGNGYGQFILPRIGHEVIVSFMNGDPDKPVITGAVYNAKNRVPYELPANKTRSTFKTSSSLGGDNFNELSFEDKKQSEQIALHAAKNLDVQIQHNRTQEIHQQDHLTVHGSRYQEVKRDSHTTVNGTQFETIKGDDHQQVGKERHTEVGSKLLSEVGSEIHVKAGQKIVIEAGNEITVTAGGSLLKVDPSGVTLLGPMVKINSGGSAGSGSGIALLSPELPFVSSPSTSGKGLPLVETQEHTADKLVLPNYEALVKRGSAIVETCTCGEAKPCPIHPK